MENPDQFKILQDIHNGVMTKVPYYVTINQSNKEFGIRLSDHKNKYDYISDVTMQLLDNKLLLSGIRRVFIDPSMFGENDLRLNLFCKTSEDIYYFNSSFTKNIVKHFIKEGSDINFKNELRKVQGIGEIEIFEIPKNVVDLSKVVLSYEQNIQLYTHGSPFHLSFNYQKQSKLIQQIDDKETSKDSK